MLVIGLHENQWYSELWGGGGGGNINHNDIHAEPLIQ